MGVRRRECEHGVRDAHETRESEPCLRCIDDTWRRVQPHIHIGLRAPHRGEGLPPALDSFRLSCSAVTFLNLIRAWAVI